MTAGLNMMHVSKISLVPIYSRRLRKMEEKKFSYLSDLYFYLFIFFLSKLTIPSFPLFIITFLVSYKDLNFLFFSFAHKITAKADRKLSPSKGPKLEIFESEFFYTNQTCTGR
jgi:hypothetical protein